MRWAPMAAPCSWTVVGIESALQVLLLMQYLLLGFSFYILRSSWNILLRRGGDTLTLLISYSLVVWRHFTTLILSVLFSLLIKKKSAFISCSCFLLSYMCCEYECPGTLTLLPLWDRTSFSSTKMLISFPLCLFCCVFLRQGRAVSSGWPEIHSLPTPASQMLEYLCPHHIQLQFHLMAGWHQNLSGNLDLENFLHCFKS